MADSEKLKPRAMRLTDETADKFREITKELGAKFRERPWIENGY